jgi:hypothetical protein
VSHQHLALSLKFVIFSLRNFERCYVMPRWSQ